MKSITRLGTRSLRTTIILLSILALAIPFAVFADELVAGGDDLVGNNLNLGNICLDSTGSGTVHLAIERSQGGANQFRNGSTVTVSVINVTGTGLSTDSSNVGTIAIPSNWDSQPSGSKTSGVTSSITLEPTTLGTFSGSISYRAEGVNQSQGSALVRNASININANIVNCAPSITETELDVDPATGTYGGETALSATLTAGGPGVEGKSVDFLLGGDPVGSADTNGDGVATLSNVSIAGYSATAHLGAIEASFAGDDDFAPSGGAADLTVDKATPVVTWSDPADITFGTALGNDQLNASADVDGEFAYSPAAGTVLDPGTHMLSTDFTPDDTTNYNSVTGTTVSITVIKSAGSVSIDNIPTDATYGGSFTPTFDALGDGSPSVASLTDAVCSVADGVVSFDAAGECTLQASITEGTHHQAATGEPQSFMISTAAATISLSDLEHTYDGDPKSATATTEPAGLSGVTITYDGETDPPVNAGSYDVVASLSNSNYQASDATGTMVIHQANQTIEFPGIADKTYGDDAFDPGATSDSGLAVSYSASGDCSIVDGMVQIDGAGSCEVTASQAGNENYNAAQDVSQAFTITQRAITVTADAQSKVYGEADPALTHQITEGSLVDGDDFSGALSRDAGEDVGSYAINQGTLTAGSNYNLTFVSNELTITARAIEVTAHAKSKVYGAADPELTFELTDGELVGDDDFSGALTRETGEDVGIYAIQQGTLTAGSNYNLTFVGADFEITARFIQVTAHDKSKVFGEDDPTLTFAVTEGSLIPGDSFSGAIAREAGEDAGTYAIEQGDLALSSNYVLGFVPGTLTITPRAIEVTADAKSKVYGEDDPSLTYQITDGELVGDDNFTGELIRAAGEDVGTYVIQQGDLALNSNYNLSFIGADFEITARAIEVTAEAKTKTYGEADPDLTYDVTSGSLVDGDEFTGELAREAGEDVGTYAIEQGTLTAGPNYNLTFVSDDLTITPRDIEVTADPQTKVYGDNDPELTYEVTGGSLVDGDAFSGSLSRATGEGVEDSPYAILQGTLTAGSNYNLNFIGANLTITPRAIEVTADPQTKVYGEDDPTLTYGITDGELVNGDGFFGALTREEGEDVGSYAIQQGTLTAGTNYSLTFVSDDLTITKRAITVGADNKFKLLGASDPDLTYKITAGNLVDGDEFSGALTREPGENVGTYAINQGSLTAGENYDLTYAAGTLTIGYNVCVDFDNEKAHKTGSTIPVRIALCDVDGKNYSAGDITVKADRMVKTSNMVTNEQAEHSGNANPDNDFRFAGGRYIYNLSTKGMSQGQWKLTFTVEGQTSPGYHVTFELKK